MTKEITIVLETDTRRYTEFIKGRDFQELVSDFFECQNNNANIHLNNMSFDEYARMICFTYGDKTIKELNGNHFIYGWLESFFQSNNVMPWMLEAIDMKELKICVFRYAINYGIEPT